MMSFRPDAAMPLKGDLGLEPPGQCAILARFGEVAEWLKAAPC